MFSIIISILILIGQHSSGFAVADALSYRLGPYERACFYTVLQNTTTPMKVSFYYYVQPQDQKSSTQDQRIEVRATNPQGKILILSTDKTTGDHEFTEDIIPGDYMFCFSNVMFVTPKIVDFEITLLEKDADVQENIDANSMGPRGPNLSQSKLTKFEDTLSSLHIDLRTLNNYQKYFRNRDYRNKVTVDATGTLLLWFTMAEIIIFGGMSYLQTYMLKSYFTTSTKVRL
jgi:hypothetical protein